MTQNIYPALRYADARAAIDFLKRTFGFEEIAVMTDDDGRVAHAELDLDGGVVMLGSRIGDSDSEERFPSGPTTIYVALDDPDGHHARARSAGAQIVMELTDQPYGSREYAARDPEGNVWCFGTYRPKPRDLLRS
ncbi:VOC family protein [Actinopolymorpha alba]|uniref:VOC family protein n=1 Tax=Actinopolymorpha alba TaxID=533267 RepID=UPI00037C0940|nr:VOC family protein [Actinopolymorpha alba]